MRAALILLALAAAGCDLHPYDLGTRNQNSDAGTGGDGGGGGGDADDGGGIDAPSCIPIGVDDQCNEVDDDCDGVVDQAFNKQADSNHCGMCNHRCVGMGSVQACQAGQCAFVECQPGFADHDADPLTCEYMCPLFPPRAEDCNGIDDDCDGVIDETLPAPPTGMCRITPGTPCAGTTMICEKRGAVTRWWCNYSADVEFDPSVPNGVVLQEQICNGKDGDCDGIADDSFSDLGQDCDNGGLGICRDGGKRVCDTLDPSQTRCDLTFQPDAQTATSEACDGLDNNCDGIVDNSTGPNRVIDAMSHVMVGALDYYVDTYEASHPDATLTTTGVASARSCSKPGVLPWRSVTFATAQAACAAAGKVLCSATQWQTACEGSTNTVYPYGDTFSASVCNTEPFDGVPGGADDDILLATGMAGACMAMTGAVDMSGNLKEWTSEITGTANGQSIVVQRGGSYDTPAAGATCDFRLTRAAGNVVESQTGFRCCKATAP
jgi:hypothetical protein